MEKELQEIRKEIIEARNLVIKNDHLLKNLGADLKTFGKKQELFERRSFISSAVAYALFATLAIGAGIAGAKGWVAQARTEVEILTKRADDATREAAAIRAEIEAIRTNAATAVDAYRKLGEGSAEEREKAAMAIATLDKSKLSELEVRALEDRSRDVLKQLGAEHFEAGRAAFRRREWTRAVAELKKGFALYPNHADATENGYYLGAAASEVKDWPAAVEGMKRYLVDGKNKRNRAHAYYVVGVGLEETGDAEGALASFRRGIGDYPDSDFVAFSKRHISSIRKAQRGESGEAQAAAGDE